VPVVDLPAKVELLAKVRLLANMRPLLILCACLLAICPVFGQSAQTPAAATSPTATPPGKENASVGGKVLRLDTGDPLKKARVELQSHSGVGYGVFALTDDQGQFLFENIPPDSYDLRVSRNGFVDAEYGQKRPGGSGAILTLAAAQHISDLVFKLVHTAAISGHVYDEDGEPIAKAEVNAYRASRRPGKEQRTGNEPVLTNDLGEFRIFDLTPGRYYLSVSYQHEPPFGRAIPSVNQGPSTGYLPSYYPNAADPAKAQPISVGPGDEIRPVDFFLRTARFFTVRGRVIGAFPGGTAVPGHVSLFPRGPGLAQALQGTVGNFQTKDGTFVLRDVAPGSYDLKAIYINRDLTDAQAASRQLDVIDSDVGGVTIVISRGVDIPGHIIWEGGATGDSADILVTLQPVIEEAEANFFRPTVKPDGSFLLHNIPEGSYRAVVYGNGSKGNFFLKSARYGTASVTDDGFAVQPGSDLSLELTLSPRVAQLSGAVLDADSLPAAGATVVLIPDPPHRGLSERYESATTDQNGMFSITVVTPGDYKVFSWDIADESDEQYGADWFDPEWLKPYETKGESVHLEESDHKSLNLSLLTANP
jgi:protocatechuate 3,4-dioxygenase beta subunit